MYRYATNALVCFSLSLGLLSLVGCSNNGQMPTAPVSGRVTYDGQPVTGGQLMFDPKGEGDAPGKPGAAEIREDGTFTVSTYADGDGAVVGKHMVSYAAPGPQQENAAVSSGVPTESQATTASPYEGLVPKVTEVEVEGGENTLEVELVRQ